MGWGHFGTFSRVFGHNHSKSGVNGRKLAKSRKVPVGRFDELI
jgi:hypothetical protein